MSVVVIALAIVVTTLVFSKIASVVNPPVKRRALETTTSSRVVDVTTSRHVALHS